MTDWTRVRDKDTKHEFSVAVVDPDSMEVLKKDAVDTYGNPLPAKPHLTPSQAKNAEAALLAERGASPYTWTRVRDNDTKHEFSTAVVDKDTMEVLDEPAVDTYGAPLAASPHISKAAAKSAASEEGKS